MKKKHKKKKVYSGDDLEYILLAIPKNTVGIEMVAKVVVDGKILEARESLDMADVKELRKLFLNEVGSDEDVGAMYVVPDNGA